MGGPIEDKHRKRKDKDSSPLNEIGNRDKQTNKVDTDEKTIKDQQNKKQMGKGDKKTKRGKIAIGTSGKLRPKRKKFKIKPTTLANQDKKELQ